MPAFRIRPAPFTAAALLALGLLAGCVTSGDKADKLPATTANDVTWSSDASSYRGENDRRVRYDCPANGFISSLWGADIYTDDSSVCTAAVHAGKITVAAGGTVVIEIRPGDTAYASSTRNGVTSSSWGVWSGSFIFP